MSDTDDAAHGRSWAEILEQRSTEGRAVVLRLDQAEQAVIETQRRVLTAMKAGRDYTDAVSAFEAAKVEVDRLRCEVYRMARQ